jgi:hypothetical protein
MGKVLEFKAKSTKTNKLRPDRFDDSPEARIGRVKESLNKIDKLMAEIKKLAKDEKGKIDATMP